MSHFCVSHTSRAACKVLKVWNTRFDNFPIFVFQTSSGVCWLDQVKRVRYSDFYEQRKRSFVFCFFPKIVFSQIWLFHKVGTVYFTYYSDLDKIFLLYKLCVRALKMGAMIWWLKVENSQRGIWKESVERNMKGRRDLTLQGLGIQSCWFVQGIGKHCRFH